MEFTVDAAVFDRYPAMHIGVLTLSGVDNSGSPPAATELHAAACAELASQPREAVLGDPRITLWREIYRSMGTSPKKFRSSVEALARRVLSSGALPRISTVVDVYNVASVAYLLPFGAFDASAVSGSLRVRFSPGGESFAPLGTDELQHTDAGEVVYSDDKHVLTRRWNHRDCDATKVTPESTDVVVLGEAASDGLVPLLTEAMSFVATTLHDTAGASAVASAILERDTPRVTLL